MVAPGDQVCRCEESVRTWLSLETRYAGEAGVACSALRPGPADAAGRTQPALGSDDALQSGGALLAAVSRLARRSNHSSLTDAALETARPSCTYTERSQPANAEQLSLARPHVGVI